MRRMDGLDYDGMTLAAIGAALTAMTILLGQAMTASVGRPATEAPPSPREAGAPPAPPPEAGPLKPAAFPAPRRPAPPETRLPPGQWCIERRQVSLRLAMLCGRAAGLPPAGGRPLLSAKIPAGAAGPVAAGGGRPAGRRPLPPAPRADLLRRAASVAARRAPCRRLVAAGRPSPPRCAGPDSMRARPSRVRERA